MAEEQEGDGGEAVDGGSVGGVNAEGSVVVLVGDHFGLATTSFGANGEDEGYEMQSDDED